MPEQWRYRGQNIDSEQVAQLREFIAAHPESSRWKLSRQLCEALGWKQPNGALRDVVCRGLLLMLQRAGQTEAAVDIARIAGMYPAGVICEIMNEDGTMARLPELEKFSAEHDIRLISVASLIEYRKRTERLVQKTAQTTTPPAW